MSAISVAIEKVGGAIAAAKVCGIRRQAVDKWVSKGSLPRTDYTGETDYAERLAAASDGQFTADWLRTEAMPKKSAA